MLEVHIGLDDSDDFAWGCTTNLLREIVREIWRSPLANKIVFIDYPLLTRLNPAIPHKTRGNGAVSLHIRVSSEDVVREIRDLILQLIDPERRLSGREPGAIILQDTMSFELAKFLYEKTLTDYTTLDLVYRVLDKTKSQAIVRGRGLIGSLASIAHHFIENDCTYELIGYTIRSSDLFISPARVYEMDRETYPHTFNNIDEETRKILLTPSIGRPVSIGIRGESPRVLLKAFNIIRPEGIDEILIFRSNQGTDQHLIPRKLSDARVYQSGLFEGFIARDPEIHVGGDVFIELREESDPNASVRVAFYREFKEGNIVARRLRRGDRVLVGGTVKPLASSDGAREYIINAEYLKILSLARVLREENPKCPRCGHTMKSLGVGKGFKCPKCGYRDRSARKILVEIARDSSILNRVFKPPPRNMKHLTKPLQRFGLEKICKRNIHRVIDIGEFYKIIK